MQFPKITLANTLSIILCILVQQNAAIARPGWACTPFLAQVKQSETAGQPHSPDMQGTAASPSPPGTPQGIANNNRKIEILFGGSLCPVCLIAFEKRLAATDGIVSAHIEALDTGHHTGHPPKRAHALIEFAPEKITQATLVEMVKNNDFQFLKAQELER